MRIDSKIGADADDFAKRIEDAEMHLEMTAHTKTGKAVLVHEVKDLFIVTESSVYCAGEGNIKLKEPSFRIRSTEFANGIQRDTVHDYSLRGVDPYIAETSLHLGLHPSKLALTPAVAHDHLASFGADSQSLDLYQDLGMVPEDAAKAIRMQQQMADSGQDDAQASTDYLADMSGYEFTMNDEGMSL